MEKKLITRREALSIGVGFGFLAIDRSVHARSDERQEIELNAKEVESLHTKRMFETQALLSGQSSTDREGLDKLVYFLYKRDVLSKESKNHLHDLVDRVTSSENIEALDESIKQFRNKIKDKMQELVTAITGVVTSTIRVIKEMPPEKRKYALQIVAADLSGALSGAGTGAKWGAYGALVGAAIGATSSSILAAYSK